MEPVFSIAELAAASGATRAEVAAWVEAGAIRALPVGDGATWIAAPEAVRAARAIRRGTIGAGVRVQPAPAGLFGSGPSSARPSRVPLAASGSLHAGAVAAVVLAATLGFGHASAVSESEPLRPEPMRLVYLALPGPGGGGGGGGLRQPAPPPRAKREGARSVSSPVAARPSPPPPQPREPEAAPEPAPVQAPVAEVAADPETMAGVVEPSPADHPSRGPGDGGGTGTGTGEGVGEGAGAGIGEGTGGGTGGGPYRPGSGIEPPRLLREVKPEYSDQARRRGVSGEVVMEIVVRHDGSVGDVRVLQGLGYGLDERAVSAVRRWQFAPATRLGRPVDVLVEVAMEFALR